MTSPQLDLLSLVPDTCKVVHSCQDFVQEMGALRTSGVELSETHFDIDLHSFIRDTPARAMVKHVKDHRQRIPRFVIRRYLEKSIQKKLFCHLQSLQIKTVFQEKNDYKLNFRKFTVAVYVIYIYGRDVTHWCQL